MAENKEIQVQVKKIPAFTVLKNSSILKNIFLLRKPPPFDPSSINQDSDEEILLVGRHPHCNITLEHPSISRYHLRIHTNPFSQMLSVVDLSSVHGTWVSGKRIEPGVRVNLKEGDKVKMGGSSRIYELRWVPMAHAFDANDPFVPAVYTIKEGEEEINQDEKPEAHSSDDDLEFLNLSSSDKIHCSPLNKLNPLTSPMLNYLNSSCDDTVVEGHLIPSKTYSENSEIFSTVLVQSPLVSGTITAIKYFTTLSKSENQSRDNRSDEFEQENYGIIKDDPFSVPNFPKSSCDDMSEKLEPQNHGIIKNDPFTLPNCSNSSCDDTDVEHSSPLKTGHENGGISTTTEAISESENQSNWLRDTMSEEFEQLGHGTTKDDLVSVAFFDDIEMHEKDALYQYIARGNDIEVCSETVNQQKMDDGSVSVALLNGVNRDEDGSFMADRARDKEVNVGFEFEQMNQTKMMDEFAYAVLYDGVDSKVDNDALCTSLLMDNMSEEFEQLSHGTTKDDLVSMALFDAIETQEKDALYQDIARGNEIEMCSENEPVNQQKIDDGSVPEALFSVVNSEEVNVGIEFEQMNPTKMMDEFADCKVGNDALCTSLISRELICHDITEKESVFVALCDGTDMDQERGFTPDVPRAKEVHANLEAMKNASISQTLFNSSDGNELEIFTPDKENKNPNACLAKSLKKRWKEDEHKQSNHHTMSKKTVSPAINEEKANFVFSKNLLKSLDESTGVITTDEEKFVSDSLLRRSLNMVDKVCSFNHREEVSFSSSEKETKSRSMKMEGSCSSINYPQTVQKTIDSSLNFVGGAKQRWTMVVDANSLLHNESLKHLKLLQGLKGTQLFIPKIVIRELMDIKWQHDDLLAKSTKKVSLALKWIDECVVNTKWWIQVDDEFLDSSEAEPNVLKTALHLRKEITDRKIIILSNDLTLKIKAMAEGVMCEAADEFRRSLVNPFSERFMWVGSLARGPTWSCVDDDEVLRQKYHGCGSHRLQGLRLLACITTFW